jgi:putative transposase
VTINISDQKRDLAQSSHGASSPSQAAVDRLADLLPTDALEEALKGLEPDEITGPGGLLTQLAGRVIESALGAELTDHLGHPPGGVPQSANVRNGAGRKTVQTDLGAVEVRTPRDRDGSFEPRLVAKRQTRLAGLDDKILGLYAGGMTVRDISAHLSELYGVDVRRDTISRVSDAVLETSPRGARGRWRRSIRSSTSTRCS